MGRNGLHFLPQENPHTKVIMKLITKGGFSSKLRIECLVELGHEARTHRPSPSSSNYNALKPIYTRRPYERRQVVTR